MTCANDPAPKPPEASSAPEPSPISIQAIPPPPARSTATKTPSPGEEKPSNAPKRKHLTPEKLAARIARLDRVLVLVVLVLAFLLGSFVASNTDFWMHLATGRRIATGAYDFRDNLFAYSTQERWVNPAWLSDLAFYGLAGAPQPGAEPVFGGALLVIAKALVATALALVLLLIHRPGQSLWIPACCTALGMIALSPRLLLQPSCISFLFLALTLYLLQRPASRGETVTPDGGALPPPPAPGRHLFALPVLFALWANLDQWFVLGPITVLLYLLGQALQRVLPTMPAAEDAPASAGLSRLSALFLLSLAACLLNPYHVHVFKLPSDLWAAMRGSALAEDGQFKSLFVSVFSGVYWSAREGMVGNVAGFAHLFLVALGLLSFGLNYAGWRWWRFLLWLAFCALGAWLVRLIPFFAVIAAPITALNFQDFTARHLGTARRAGSAWVLWSLAGRVLSVLAGFVLLGLAWPGLLQAQLENWDNPRLLHRVGWRVAADPSLVQACRRLRELRAQGVLRPESHGFNFNFEMANYCAWFCSAEQGFFDLRLPLFAGEPLAQYLAVCQALDPLRFPKNREAPVLPRPTGWQKIFRDHGVDHIIINTNLPTLGWNRRLRLLLQDKLQWEVLYMDGRTLVLGWNDWRTKPPNADRFRLARFDAAQRAFAPNLPEADRAPETPPDSPRPPEDWQEQVGRYLKFYWKGRPARPLATDQAGMYDLYYWLELQRAQESYAIARRVAAWIVPATTAYSGGAGPSGASTLALMYGVSEGGLLNALDLGQPGLWLSALRAARRAIAANPEDPETYRTLASAYDQLWTLQEERWLAASYPQAQKLRQLRQVQEATAWHQSLVLDPRSEIAKRRLASLFLQITMLDPLTGREINSHLDAGMDLLREGLEEKRNNGPGSGESELDFQREVQSFEDKIKQLDKNYDLQRRRNEYDLRAKDKPPLIKARLALHFGLAKEALEVLNKSSPIDRDPEEAKLGVFLAMTLGLGGELPKPELAPSDWDNVLLAAALGDYALADQTMSELIKRVESESTYRLLTLVRGQSFETIIRPHSLYGMAAEAARALQLQADLVAVRGVLALEKGDTEAAARHLAQTLGLGAPVRSAGVLSFLGANSPLTEVGILGAATYGGPGWFYFDMQPIAFRYLQLLQDARRDNRRQ